MDLHSVCEPYPTAPLWMDMSGVCDAALGPHTSQDCRAHPTNDLKRPGLPPCRRQWCAWMPAIPGRAFSLDHLLQRAKAHRRVRP